MRRIRIGIDTGGTFTDVVAFDEDSGGIVTTKTPSTPADPAEGFMTGVAKVLALMSAGPADVTAVSHGTTVATNQLLEGRIDRLGFVTTEGFELLLEIARQSVPDGYGNSYFWVKPPRIVPADLVRAVGGRLSHTGAEIRPFDEAGARAAARFYRDAGINTLAVCFLHAYANPAHEQRMRAVLAEEHPDAVVSLSSEVLREYREYERAMTTLVDAAVKPRVAAYVRTIRAHLDALKPGVPFSIMKSNGGVLSADEVVHQPITTVLSGPAAGALGAALVAEAAGYDRVLTLDGGGTSTDVSVVLHGEPTLTTEGTVGAYPSKIPMIDIVTVGAGGGSVAWLSREGTLKVGPRSAGADPGPLCYRRGGTEPTVTDAHLVLGRIPPHLLGGEVPLDVGAARDGLRRAGRQAGPAGGEARGRHPGDLRLEPGQRAAPGHGQARTGRPRLRAHHVRRVRVAAAVPADRHPRPARRRGAARSRQPVGVRAAHRGRQERLRADPRDPPRPSGRRGRGRALRRADRPRPPARCGAEGFPDDRHRYARTADLRYFGQAFEVRVPRRRAVRGTTTVAAFHDAHEQLYGYCFRDRPEQQVEWVNLRVTGIGPIRRPALRPAPSTGGGAPGRRPVCLRRLRSDHADLLARRPARRAGG